MERRTRKFEYNIEDIDRNHVDMLKEIDCKYHIIGFYNKNLYGFIYFNFTKTISAVEKLLSSTQIKCANKPRDSYVKIRKLDNVWEDGSYIIEKKKKDVFIKTQIKK